MTDVRAHINDDQQPSTEDTAEADGSLATGTAISPTDDACPLRPIPQSSQEEEEKDDDGGGGGVVVVDDDDMHMPMFPLHQENTVHDVESAPQSNEPLERQQKSTRKPLSSFVNRVMGVLDIPLILIFDIILYLMDVGSDIAAAVVYFQEGHPVWGSLTITFVLLPAICSAAVSWVWWYYDRGEDNNEGPAYRRSRVPTYRTMRMVFCVLLLDPLVRYDDKQLCLLFEAVLRFVGLNLLLGLNLWDTIIQIWFRPCVCCDPCVIFTAPQHNISVNKFNYIFPYPVSFTVDYIKVRC